MMNRSVPDWDMENDTRSFLDHLPMEYQKKPMSPNDELVELLWRNGHVVMHSQTHRKSPPIVTECRQSQKREHSFKGGDPLGSSSDPIHEDEAGSWFQYSLEDSLEKEFCSEFFSEIPAADPICVDNLNRNAVAEESHLYFEGSAVLPPTSQQPPISGNDCVLNFSHFSRPMNAGLGFLSDKSRQKGLANGNHLGIGESSSMMTIGTSGCGSNQVQNRIDENHTLSKDEITRSAKENIQMRSPCEGVQMNTSTSGGSGSSFGKTVLKNAGEPNHKRKGRDGSESECHSEEANKPAQRSVSTRRSRSTEVHNQSERRRRDKINEKMKALQELIPHSNKSDKASMLDEAIEYLKSLQLQVQIMWMGGGMAPMMFPGVQQFTPYMGVGSPHATMHPIHNPVQLSGATPINRSIPSSSTANIPPICPLPPLNPVNFTTQMQNSFLAESYARYFAFHRMQPPLPHAMHLYAHGSQIEQQNQPAAVNSSCLPAFGPVPSGKTQNG